MKVKQGIGFIFKIRDQWSANVENGDPIAAIANRMSTNIFEDVRRPVWIFVHNRFMFYNLCGHESLEYALLNCYENL